MTRRTRAKGKRGREEGGRVSRKRRRFISRTTRKCSNRARFRYVYRRDPATACVRPFLCTYHEQAAGPKSAVGGPRGGSYYARRGPSNQPTRRFGRSGSTLKHGIYCGNSFCSIIRPHNHLAAPPSSFFFFKGVRKFSDFLSRERKNYRNDRY